MQKKITIKSIQHNNKQIKKKVSLTQLKFISLLEINRTMKVIVYSSKYEKGNSLEKVIHVLLEKGYEILLEEYFYNLITANHTSPLISLLKGYNETIDFAISIGGDGTLLKSTAKIKDKNIPILGINAGRLGFLTESAATEFEKCLQCITNKTCKVESRTLLAVEIDSNLPNNLNTALNEIAILKQDTASMLTIRVTIDNQFLSAYEADGLIIATPTGSTAYSLSVGGPILTPLIPSFILSPVAPHTLTARPLVIDDQSILDIEVTSRGSNFLLSLDGRSVCVPTSKTFRIQKASYSIKLLRPEGYSFFDTLRNKLFWGTDPRSKN